MAGVGVRDGSARVRYLILSKCRAGSASSRDEARGLAPGRAATAVGSKATLEPRRPRPGKCGLSRHQHNFVPQQPWADADDAPELAADGHPYFLPSKGVTAGAITAPWALTSKI